MQAPSYVPRHLAKQWLSIYTIYQEQLGSQTISKMMADQILPLESENFFDKSSGIQVVDERLFVAWYSNNFEDKDKEFFPTKAIDNSISRKNRGDYRQPELWSHHQEYLKHGEALKVVRLGHFVVAAGIFDSPQENDLVEPFKAWYESSERVTMSHGFEFNPLEYRDKAFWEFDTFEISTLRPGMEANPYTLFSMEDAMPLTKEDEKFLEGLLGSDRLQKLKTTSQKAGSKIRGANINFKAKDPKKKPPKKKPGAEDDEEAKDLDDEDEVDDLTADLDDWDIPDDEDEEEDDDDEDEDDDFDGKSIKSLVRLVKDLHRRVDASRDGDAVLVAISKEQRKQGKLITRLAEAVVSLSQKSRPSKDPRTILDPENKRAADFLLSKNGYDEDGEEDDDTMSIMAQLSKGITQPVAPSRQKKKSKSESKID